MKYKNFFIWFFVFIGGGCLYLVIKYSIFLKLVIPQNEILNVVLISLFISLGLSFFSRDLLNPSKPFTKMGEK